jgi:hypothetical protein
MIMWLCDDKVMTDIFLRRLIEDFEGIIILQISGRWWLLIRTLEKLLNVICRNSLFGLLNLVIRNYRLVHCCLVIMP